MMWMFLLFSPTFYRRKAAKVAARYERLSFFVRLVRIWAFPAGPLLVTVAVFLLSSGVVRLGAAVTFLFAWNKECRKALWADFTAADAIRYQRTEYWVGLCDRCGFFMPDLDQRVKEGEPAKRLYPKVVTRLGPLFHNHRKILGQLIRGNYREAVRRTWVEHEISLLERQIPTSKWADLMPAGLQRYYNASAAPVTRLGPSTLRIRCITDRPFVRVEMEDEAEAEAEAMA